MAPGSTMTMKSFLSSLCWSLWKMVLVRLLNISRSQSQQKPFGQMTCPTGSSDRSIVQMKGKAQGWVDKAKLSKLNKRILTFHLDKQFGPGVAFGIISICALFSELEDCLMQIYYQMLPMCRICRSVCVGCANAV